MKKSLLLLAISATSLIGTAQTSVETLKKDLSSSKSENQKLKDENKFLNEKLIMCEALAADTVVKISSFSNLYTINYLSCKGDRGSQTVTVEFLISQKSTNKKIIVDNTTSLAVDILGNQFSVTNIYKQSYSYYVVFTDTPVKMSFIIKNVLPGTEAISLLALKMSTGEMDNPSYNYALTELRNLKITW